MSPFLNKSCFVFNFIKLYIHLSDYHFIYTFLKNCIIEMNLVTKEWTWGYQHSKRPLHVCPAWHFLWLSPWHLLFQSVLSSSCKGVFSFEGGTCLIRVCIPQGPGTVPWKSQICINYLMNEWEHLPFPPVSVTYKDLIHPFPFLTQFSVIDTHLFYVL